VCSAGLLLQDPESGEHDAGDRGREVCGCGDEGVRRGSGRRAEDGRLVLGVALDDGQAGGRGVHGGGVGDRGRQEEGDGGEEDQRNHGRKHSATHRAEARPPAMVRVCRASSRRLGTMKMGAHVSGVEWVWFRGRDRVRLGPPVSE
jgi:hypothetical protein